MHWLNNRENDIEIFIDDFMGGAYGDRYSQKIISDKFKNGYCYYFAHLLQNAFGRGTVCWAAPLYHFVWQDINGVAYDIDGKYNVKEHDVFYLIPEKYTGKLKDDFLHTFAADAMKCMTKEKLIKIIKKWCRRINVPYDSQIEDYFYDFKEDHKLKK